MKKRTRKTLLVVCSALIVLGVSVGVTLAYLTDSEAVTNTFTVGQVHIKLDETDVNASETEPDAPVNTDKPERVTANSYHLIPGETYVKDPTVTMLAGSEEAYVRMLVTVHDYDDLLAVCKTEGESVVGDTVLLQDFVDWNSTEWPCHQAGFKRDLTSDTATYEFRYYTTTENTISSDKMLEPLFETFTLLGWMDNTDLLLLGENGWKVTEVDEAGKITAYTGNAENEEPMKIVVVAHAIQKAGFDSAEAAWEAFDAQHSN